jgi:hypothetical protein
MGMFTIDTKKGETLESLRKKRAAAEAYLSQGHGVASNPWEGLAQIGSALGARMRMSSADKAIASGMQGASVKVKPLVDAYFGSGGAPVKPSPEVAAFTAQGSAPLVSVKKGDGSWLQYANQSATRNQPLNEKLVSSLSFLPELGVSMKVFSGGQDATGPRRTGSHRHDHGNSGDVFFYKDGKQLDWRNESDIPTLQAIVSRSRANGVTGFGAGEGYMHPGSMHIGFGSPAVWGAGGSGRNAPGWLRTAFEARHAPQQPTASPQQALNPTLGSQTAEGLQAPSMLAPAQMAQAAPVIDPRIQQAIIGQNKPSAPGNPAVQAFMGPQAQPVPQPMQPQPPMPMPGMQAPAQPHIVPASAPPEPQVPLAPQQMPPQMPQMPQMIPRQREISYPGMPLNDMDRGMQPAWKRQQMAQGGPPQAPAQLQQMLQQSQGVPPPEPVQTAPIGTPMQPGPAAPQGQPMAQQGGLPQIDPQTLLNLAQDEWVMSNPVYADMIKSMLEQQMKSRDPATQMALRKAQLELQNLENPQMSPADKERILLEREKFKYEQGKPIVAGGDSRIFDPSEQKLLLDAVPKERPLPAGIQEYEYAKQQGFKGTFQDWEASKKGGMSLQVDPATGQVTFQQGSNIKPLTEAQSKDTVFATRAEGALRKLEPQANALTDPFSAVGSKIPGIGNYLKGTAYQNAEQAGTEFLQAILRKDTGAAITPAEQKEYGRVYLPAPGDGPEVKLQKKASRSRAVEALKAGMTPQAILAQEGALRQNGDAAQSSASGAPQPGHVEDGYRFKGGDPSSPDSWEKVN